MSQATDMSTLPPGYSEFWLIAPMNCGLHLMRYIGQDPDDRRIHSWKPVCGSRFSDEAWDGGDWNWSSTFADAVEWNMAICKRCRPLMEQLAGEGRI